MHVKTFKRGFQNVVQTNHIRETFSRTLAAKVVIFVFCKVEASLGVIFFKVTRVPKYVFITRASPCPQENRI